MSLLPEAIREALRTQACLKLVLSGKQPGCENAPEKVTVRPVQVRGQDVYQLAQRHAAGETHENLASPAAAQRVAELFGSVFRHCHAATAQSELDAHLQEDGSVAFQERPLALYAEQIATPRHDAAAGAHNRTKNYIIPDGQPCPFLIEIGVMTQSGHVRAAKQAKFRQINRFLELVDDVTGALAPGEELHVVDFGCGKSYLTFALQHLLANVHGRKVRIVGIDRNAEVMAECSRVARLLGLKDVTFQTCDIAEYEPAGKVHMTVSLHACDTATDFAVAKAVGWESDVILAVPCCQHELAGMIDVHDLSPLTKHGILKERFAALATDALRAALLELCGYKTQVVEFIDMEHTAKNVLIRAVRRDVSVPASQLAEQRESLARFKALLGIDQTTLELALGRKN